MCGISGFFDFSKKSDAQVLQLMVSTMNHRGPDDQGEKLYHFEKATIGLGQNRLSIIDLSSGGHQPMIYKHLCIAFNGEIYNYQEIKDELLQIGHLFISGSDTEVILHAFEEWGENCVERFIGMFAFAILDENLQKITIIRDRAGVKPLFYYWYEGLFLFASELKAFHKHPHFVKEINEQSVHQYIDFGYIPTPNCIFKNCNKLKPGHILTIDVNTQFVSIKKYWDVYDYYRLPKLKISYEDAMNEVEKLLISAFEYRMVADVPVGVFLSGGYDSTIVAAILQHSRINSKIKTFTIGFADGNDEAPYAKEIAKYIGTEHTEHYCTAKEAQDIIPTLPYFYDEPFADSSSIPTILVSKVAKEKVTVALSADAGDELFAGYAYYKAFHSYIDFFNKIPIFLRKPLSWLVRIIDNFSFGYDLKNKLDVLADVLDANSADLAQILHHKYSEINRKAVQNLFINKDFIYKNEFEDRFFNATGNLSVALGTDYKMYLQNDILVKVDRATMSVSLEGREPFLDHRILEFVAQLPDDYKYEKVQKRILKDIAYKYVPKKLLDRPKAGFSLPIDSWLKKELSYLMDDYLSDSAIIKSGFFNVTYVQKLKKDFLANKMHDTSIIWRLLQFQMWYIRWMN